MDDILIRGMEMPESCDKCSLFNECWCMALGIENWRKSYNKPEQGERLPDCPLVPLPEGHGRLGDLDKLEDAFIRYYLEQERNNNLVFAAVEIKQHIADMIEDWPTIVPAEGASADGN